MIRLGNSGLTLCRWGEQQRPSREEIASLLHRFASDEFVLMELRSLVRDRTSDPVETLAGDQLIDAVAGLVHSGELLLFGSAVVTVERSLSPAPVPRPTAGGPPPARKAAQAAAPEAPPKEPPIVPPDANRASLVMLLRSAADSGVPFCDT